MPYIPTVILLNWCVENQHNMPVLKIVHRSSYYVCEIYIMRFNYTASRISKFKEDAIRLASIDYLLYLIFNQYLPREFIPIIINYNLNINVTNGGWTAKTAERCLYNFLKSNKTKFKKEDYNLRLMGNYVVAETSILFTTSNERLIVYECSTSKNLAIQKCALLLVSKLYHLGIIKGTEENTLSYEVNIEPSTITEVLKFLKEQQIEPVIKNDTVVDPNITQSLILNQVFPEHHEPDTVVCNKVISWSSPCSNWNPWLATQNTLNVNLDQLSEELKISFEKHFVTSGLNPSIVMRHGLIIFNKMHCISNAILNNPVVIIQGSVGCGKTTQVCQYILESCIQKNKGAYCSIICTQKSEAAAIFAAYRVAHQRKEEIGLSVGYSVKGDNIFPRPYGAILFCTIDLLLEKLKKGLDGISHIVVDDIHERNAYCDLLMAILKDMTLKDSYLKVIFMSNHTRNSDKFSVYFNYCPVIKVNEVISHVIEYYLDELVKTIQFQSKFYLQHTFSNKTIAAWVNDIKAKDCKETILPMLSSLDHYYIIIDILNHIKANISSSGGVLVFVATSSLVQTLYDKLQTFPSYMVVKLHSKMTYTQQCKVFEPLCSGRRKVILSTKIAENMKNHFNDIRFIINFAKERVQLLNKNKVYYSMDWVSKESMLLRKSLVGSFQQSGHCFHICTEVEYNDMTDNLIPEICRIPLYKIALCIKDLQLGDIKQYFTKVIEPPHIDDVTEAIEMLKEMKCLGQNNDLSPVGKVLAKLPFGPQMGRMFVMANILKIGDALASAAVICSNMTSLLIPKKKWHYDFPCVYRCSDHLNTINLFITQESLSHHVSSISENYGMVFQQHFDKLADFKKQLMNVFIKIGFPEIWFFEKQYNFQKKRIQGDPMLDVLSAILLMGSYPNTCCNIEKDQITSEENITTFIPNNSIVNEVFEQSHQSSFFVFTKLAKHDDDDDDFDELYCNQINMLSPLHLLLFGARKIELTNGFVQLDSWIHLKMNEHHAAAVVALRSVIDRLIWKACEKPKSVENLDGIGFKLNAIFKKLCNLNDGRYNCPPLLSHNLCCVKPFGDSYDEVTHENI